VTDFLSGLATGLLICGVFAALAYVRDCRLAMRRRRMVRAIAGMLDAEGGR